MDTSHPGKFILKYPTFLNKRFWILLIFSISTKFTYCTLLLRVSPVRNYSNLCGSSRFLPPPSGGTCRLDAVKLFYFFLPGVPRETEKPSPSPGRGYRWDPAIVSFETGRVLHLSL